MMGSSRERANTLSWMHRAERFHLPLIVVLATLFGLSAAGLAAPFQDEAESSPAQSETEPVSIEARPVTLDGRLIWRVRGITSFPARERAQLISSRIRALAANPKFSPDELRLVEDASGEMTNIKVGESLVAGVHDLDARMEGVGRQLLAGIVKDRIAEVIGLYREDRKPRNLLVSCGESVAATALLILLVFLSRRFLRLQEGWIEKRYQKRFDELHEEHLETVYADRLKGAIRGVLQAQHSFILIVLIVAYGQYVLSRFPWTRGLAEEGLGLILGPLRSMGWALLDATPGLVFIGLVVLLVRYTLKLLRVLFASVEDRRFRISGFDPEWSWPTYKILRLVLIVFGVIISYPYIPGADTAAFKGVSVFLGLVFSLSSTSTISNVIAGYTLTYRRAFKVGDLVKIGDALGEVEEVRLQVTHLRSLKNEEVIVPNSIVLNSSITNYSSRASQRGLILHTTVGIGYETPWRQVEAMLLRAAESTTGLLKKPEPFVLQTGLGDFCVTYELNVFTDRPKELRRLYTALHRSIQDVFNEYGVQIMTPAYETDPAEPKIVPKEKWFEPPAVMKHGSMASEEGKGVQSDSRQSDE